jgi:hypothetical protein
MRRRLKNCMALEDLDFGFGRVILIGDAEMEKMLLWLCCFILLWS